MIQGGAEQKAQGGGSKGMWIEEAIMPTVARVQSLDYVLDRDSSNFHEIKRHPDAWECCYAMTRSVVLEIQERLVQMLAAKPCLLIKRTEAYGAKVVYSIETPKLRI